MLAVGLVAAAIGGYIAGHTHARTSTEGSRSAAIAGVLLDYPANWTAPSRAPEIQGLAISHPLVLAPGGDGTRAALIAGELPGGGPTPLPQPFVALLRAVPQTEVVELLGNQAFRYGHVQLSGYPGQLTVYALPDPGGEVTVLACSAGADQGDLLGTCERIVSTITLVKQSQGYDLRPSAAYARGLADVLRTLGERRSASRAQMTPGASPAALQRSATALAGDFADAAAAVGSLEPSLIAARAQQTLISALQQAQRAYLAFAAAVPGGNAALTPARASVYEGERGVDEALQNFALLGYRPA
jgi:hypothetical protein